MKEPPFPPTVPGLLRHIATKYADLEALVGPDGRLTYRQLEQQSARLATALLARGIGKGTRVALLMKNSPAFAVTFFAAARIGALVTPLSTLFQAPELAWALRHADTHMLFMDAGYLGHDYVARMEQAFDGLREAQSTTLHLPDAPYLRHVFVHGENHPRWACDARALALADERVVAVEQAGLLERVEAQVTPADLFFSVYTSGSTGYPKGVVHYHGSAIRHSYRMAFEYMMAREGDRIASARPWFWVAGLSASLLYTLQAGACLVIQERDDPYITLDLIDREGVSLFSGLAPQFASLNATLDAENSRYTIRLLGNNTAGIALRGRASGEQVTFVNERLERRVPAATRTKDITHLPSFYGMSETLAAHTAEPQPDYLPDDKVPSSGRAMAGVEHKLVSPETGARVGPNERGELYVRGSTLMAGLYKRERAETFEPDGFYRTGDICLIDEDGFLRVRGRMDDMVRISGANVSPVEVERTLNAMAGVRNSAVFAMTGDDGRPQLVAAVLTIPAAPVTESEVIRYLKDRLSFYKVPKRVLLFDPDEVPHTGTGKIIRRELEPMVRKALAAD